YLLSYRLLSRIESQTASQIKFWSLIILLWVGTNKSVAGFATSGLETPLQLLFFVLIVYIYVASAQTKWTRMRLLILSSILGLSLLLRPDSIILIIAVLYLISKSFVIDTTCKRDIIVKSVLISVPMILLVLPWVIWKYSFYGTILPNSFHAKVKGLDYIGYGIFYLYIFIICYWLPPFVALLIARSKAVFKRDKLMGYILGFVLIWAVYCVWVGGDFMEFRFLVPIVPFLGISIVYVLITSINNRKILSVLIIVLLLGNLNTFFTIKKTVQSYGIEPVESLVEHVNGEDQNWVGIGKKLKEMFPDSNVSIAIGAAGAIPYYSGLKSIDFLGLCDKRIPEIAEKFSIVPGHRIIAPLEYLVNRRVNLIVEPNSFMMRQRDYHQWVRSAGWHSMYKLNINVDRPVNGYLISEANWLVIPIDSDHVMVVWYLTPHPAVEEAIAENNLNRIQLVRR
ncbi:hypothetical protein H8D57_03865, partial [bacterium]|nr:hypothetical protein [bacterium]